MKTNQKMLLIIIIIILAITSIIAVILSSKNDEIPSNESTSEYSKKLNTEIELLTNENVFFGVQTAINNYYSYIISNDNFSVYHLLLSEFRKSHNLTTSDAATKVSRFKYSPTFIAEKIYYNPNSSTTYYFTSGYVMDTPIEEGEVKYYPHINFLVVVDENNKYVLEPLEDDLDIENYAKNYNITEMVANNEMIFKTNSLSEQRKITYYINIFHNLLYIDSKKALNMLDGQSRAFFMKIDGVDESLFLKYRDTISIALDKNYNNLETKTEDAEKIYTVFDYDGDKIIIKEKSVMDIKIDFDFGW